MKLIFLIHVFCCWFMTGVISLVQILVYPNFQIIGVSPFKKFHEFHLQRITWIVAPVMVLELLTATWIAYEKSNSLTLINLGSVVVLWMLTGIINVPAHNKLDAHDEISLRKLSFKNWPRTVLWSARTIGLFWFILSHEF